MLTRLRLQDWKSFRDQAVEVGPTTLLVGANGSGKSNFLDAIRFLQGVSYGWKPSEMLRGKTEAGRQLGGIRGGTTETARFGHSEFALDSTWTRLGVVHEHELRIGLNGLTTVLFEKLTSGGTGLVSHAISRDEGTLFSLPFAGFEQDGAPETPKSLRERAAIVERFVEILTGLAMYEFLPATMRNHVPRDFTTVGSAGENLSAAVWHLCQDADRKQDLIAWLSELCSPQIVDIEFDETKLLSEVMLVLVEADGTKVSARALSDGTLRFLGNVAALLTAREGDILLFEEIETGLHPGRVHLLIDLIEEVTRGGRCQVIATTHSPLALAALSSDGLRNAIVFGRVPTEPGTIMRRLGDLPCFDDVTARTGIAEMFTTSWLERSL